jgi:hypothetical protein
MSRSIQITIGRFGESNKRITVPAGSTLKAVLKKADIKMSRSEKIWIDGARTQLTKKVERGDIINIVGSRSGGSR